MVFKYCDKSDAIPDPILPKEEEMLSVPYWDTDYNEKMISWLAIILNKLKSKSTVSVSWGIFALP